MGRLCSNIDNLYLPLRTFQIESIITNGCARNRCLVTRSLFNCKANLQLSCTVRSFLFQSDLFYPTELCRVLNFFHHFTGKALKGHAIRNIPTPNCELCQIECLSENRCLSYNCRGVSCELNSADHIEHPEDLENEEGSDYHAAEVSGYSGGEC